MIDPKTGSGSLIHRNQSVSLISHFHLLYIDHLTNREKREKVLLFLGVDGIREETLCTFENSLCGFTSHPSSNFNWRVDQFGDGTSLI